MWFILGPILVILIILLAIAVLIVLAVVLSLGLLGGIIFAYVKAAIMYIGSVNENVENLPARIFMIVVTAVVVAIPLIIILGSIIAFIVAM